MFFNVINDSKTKWRKVEGDTCVNDWNCTIRCLEGIRIAYIRMTVQVIQ